MKIGKAGNDPQAIKLLVQEIVQDMVKKHSSAFSTLVSVTTSMIRMRQTIAAGSPSEGWARFIKLVATRCAAEPNKLPQAFLRLTTKDGEPPREVFSER